MPRDVSFDVDLGRCCACGQTGPQVRNVLMLNFKSPTPGRGWGCMVCHLPQDGAVAVVCDSCMERNAKLLHACDGYPYLDKRVPIETLTEPFQHVAEVHEAYETMLEARDTITHAGDYH